MEGNRAQIRPRIVADPDDHGDWPDTDPQIRWLLPAILQGSVQGVSGWAVESPEYDPVCWGESSAQCNPPIPGNRLG